MSRHSLLSESEKNSGVSVFKTHFIAQVNGAVEERKLFRLNSFLIMSNCQQKQEL